MKAKKRKQRKTKKLSFCDPEGIQEKSNSNNDNLSLKTDKVQDLFLTQKSNSNNFEKVGDSDYLNKIGSLNPSLKFEEKVHDLTLLNKKRRKVVTRLGNRRNLFDKEALKNKHNQDTFNNNKLYKPRKVGIITTSESSKISEQAIQNVNNIINSRKSFRPKIKIINYINNITILNDCSVNITNNEEVFNSAKINIEDFEKENAEPCNNKQYFEDLFLHKTDNNYDNKNNFDDNFNKKINVFKSENIKKTTYDVFKNDDTNYNFYNGIIQKDNNNIYSNIHFEQLFNFLKESKNDFANVIKILKAE